MAPPRIALLGVILESNRQSPVATRADFDSHYVLEGEALLAAARAPRSVLAPEASAFVQMMDAYKAMVTDFDLSEQRRMFHDAAAEFYRVSLPLTG